MKSKKRHNILTGYLVIGSWIFMLLLTSLHYHPADTGHISLIKEHTKESSLHDIENCRVLYEKTLIQYLDISNCKKPCIATCGINFDYSYIFELPEPHFADNHSRAPPVFS